MTYRGVEILKSVDIIAAEDTRTSTKLLKHYEIKNKLISYHKFNERKQSDILISLLSEGKNVAIITDSGTPGISDPANIIVKEAIEHNIQVCCLPGASAVITALAASGLNTDTFTFAGFLPAKKKDRDNLLKALEKLPHTIVLYEASHRIIDTLKELAEVFGSRECVIARELSKLYETYLRGKLSDLAYASDMETRGEFVILIEGRKEQPLTDAELIRIISDEAKQGIALKELSSKVSDITGINRNRIYKLALALKKCNESV
jgi:16S rRNA (cytidine1402-2'-O)-methyltransferase